MNDPFTICGLTFHQTAFDGLYKSGRYFLQRDNDGWWATWEPILRGNVQPGLRATGKAPRGAITNLRRRQQMLRELLKGEL